MWGRRGFHGQSALWSAIAPGRSRGSLEAQVALTLHLPEHPVQESPGYESRERPSTAFRRLLPNAADQLFFALPVRSPLSRWRRVSGQM